MKAKKWILAKHFDGFPKDSDLKLEEEELGQPKDGEVIIEAVYLSIDPYMRPYSARLPEGSTMIGQQVGRVIKSTNKDFPEGTLLLASVGWRSHSKINPSAKPQVAGGLPIVKVPDMGALPASLALGNLGMTGATAYFGLLRICEPKAGETVLVNAAAGAVGSMVGQIAKIKGCKVIGYAGTEEKCQWLKELGFDFAFNYKTCDVNKTLKEAAPEGIDCYFDNVGGDFTMTVVAEHMNTFGRIAVCGSITAYNNKKGEHNTGPHPWMLFVAKQLKMEGFLVQRYVNDWNFFLKDVGAWIAQGKIKYREHVTDGFENMPKAFFGILKGDNIGKAVVKA